MSRRRGENGAVTAELAVALPVLLILTVGLVWLVSLGAAQVRVVDAAREAARVVARGDDPARATALAETISPPGGRVEVSHVDGHVLVTATAVVDPPLRFLDAFGRVTLRSTSAAALEEVP